MTQSSSFQRVLPVADLPSGAKKPLVLDGKPVLLCNANGKLHAISNVCSHNEKPLERGRVGNGWIACPTHGARFDLATGKRSEEHTSELQSLMRNSYAVFCLKK